MYITVIYTNKKKKISGLIELVVFDNNKLTSAIFTKNI